MGAAYLQPYFEVKQSEMLHFLCLRGFLFCFVFENIPSLQGIVILASCFISTHVLYFFPSALPCFGKVGDGSELVSGNAAAFAA